MSYSSSESQKISNELASIDSKLLNSSKGKLQFRIDVTTALVGLEKISKELAQLPADEALNNAYTQVRQRVEQIAKELGITTSKASYNSSLSGSSYASFFGKTAGAAASSPVAQKSLDRLTQLQQKLAPVSTANNSNS